MGKQKFIFVRKPGQSKMTVYEVSVLAILQDYEMVRHVVDKIIRETGF